MYLYIYYIHIDSDFFFQELVVHLRKEVNYSPNNFRVIRVSPGIAEVPIH